MSDSPNMSFLDHLEVLRWHLIRSILVIVSLALLAFVFHEFLFDTIIFGPLDPNFFTNRNLCLIAKSIDMPALCINQKPITLINISMSGQFTAHIMISLISGLVFAFPYILWEIWRFIEPALLEIERKYARRIISAGAFLFFTGVVFAYFIIIPFSSDFFGNYHVSSKILVDNMVSLESYVSMLASASLACGLAFELPIIIYFLSKIGLITASFLKKYRKHAIVVILIISAVITPPDVISQIIVSLPLLVLYEISIVIAKRIQKAKELKNN